MGEIISIGTFDGAFKRSRVQQTTALRRCSDGRFYGNRWTQLQFPFAVLASRNWHQVTVKMGGSQRAFEEL